MWYRLIWQDLLTSAPLHPLFSTTLLLQGGFLFVFLYRDQALRDMLSSKNKGSLLNKSPTLSYSIQVELYLTIL